MTTIIRFEDGSVQLKFTGSLVIGPNGDFHEGPTGRLGTPSASSVASGPKSPLGTGLLDELTSRNVIMDLRDSVNGAASKLNTNPNDSIAQTKYSNAVVDLTLAVLASNQPGFAGSLIKGWAEKTADQAYGDAISAGLSPQAASEVNSPSVYPLWHQSPSLDPVRICNPRADLQKHRIRRNLRDRPIHLVTNNFANLI